MVIWLYLDSLCLSILGRD